MYIELLQIGDSSLHGIMSMLCNSNIINKADYLYHFISALSKFEETSDSENSENQKYSWIDICRVFRTSEQVLTCL